MSLQGGRAGGCRTREKLPGFNGAYGGAKKITECPVSDLNSVFCLRNVGRELFNHDARAAVKVLLQKTKTENKEMSTAAEESEPVEDEEHWLYGGKRQKKHPNKPPKHNRDRFSDVDPSF